jgi:YegS/Rv2252/BmrU family lipid kinase
MTRKSRVKLIVNPNADLGRAWQAAADLRTVVENYGGADWAGTVYPTHATELAYQAALEGYEIVIAAGGDGTIHEVINGLMQAPAESRPRLGIVPLGSGNDFSYAVGIDRQPAEAVRQVFTGRPVAVDVGQMVDQHGKVEYWDNTVGIGFDTTVTIRSRRFRMARGFLVYLLAVLQTIILDNDAPNLVIETDREKWNQKLLMLVMCNGSREGGGFKVAPDAIVYDGLLNYVGITQVSRPMMFRLLPEVMNGTHARFRQVKMGECQRICIKSDRPMFIHTDGEIYSGFGMDVRQITMEVIPGAIQVMTQPLT